MKLLKLISFFLLLFSGFSLFAQRVQVTGRVISDENAQPVQLANILNLASQQKAVSNRQGYFRVLIFPEDTIRFTAVGFEPLFITGTELLQSRVNDTISLLMHSTSYLLKDVTVVYSNRKRDSIARAAALYLKTDPLLNNNQRILGRPRGGANDNGTLGYTGVITELYYQFSKEGKDMVHFEQFVRYYREVQEADKRYNKEIIKRTTKLPDYMLDDYILFCKMDRQFILTAEDYDLVKAIKDCGDRYKLKNGIRE